MKTVKLCVTETLKYRREIIVNVPDEMEERELNRALDRAQRNQEYLSDFIYELKDDGITLANPYDDSLNSPDYSELECDKYDYLKAEEESA